MKINSYILLVCMTFAGMLVACSSEQDLAQEDGDLMLMYMESEPGINPHTVRMLVNKDFLRMDDGADDSSYTLLDRKKGEVFSVSHENRTVLRLQQVKSDNTISRKLIMDARRLDDNNIPAVGGKVPVHMQLLVNGNLCSDLFVIKGFHQQAIDALREFRRILSMTHVQNLDKTPEEMQDDCFLAHSVSAPGRSLQFGLPIQESDHNGVKRALVDYNQGFRVDPLVYTVPQDYRITNTGSR